MARVTMVPTPIGNLEDMTYRAVRILHEADLIAAEDTRTSAVLFKHYSISRPVVALHQHNEHVHTPRLLDRIEKEDLHLAVVTDAGTPGISDPGFLIVREAIKRGIPVETLPGPTAFVPALVNSGLPSDRFVFEGFLPVKKGRKTRLKALAVEPRSIILYESPHRLARTLEDLCTWFGPDRPACVARELTKLHEEVLRNSLALLLAHYKESNVKGEIVLIVAGAE